MIKSNSILFHILLLLNIFLFGSCKDNPVSPSSPVNNYSPYPGMFHGTWLSTYNAADSIHISFDSVSVRFLDQAGYDFGIRREFPGEFIVDSVTIALNYDYGSSSRFWYHFVDDTLLLGDSLLNFSRKYIRIDTSPNNYGWSVKPPIISEQTYPGVGAVRAFGYSDSLAVFLTYNNNQWYLTKLNPGDGTYTNELSQGTRAVDASGSFLWIATDSTIEKRTLSDTTILASFSYREAAGSDYSATGIAVGTNYCYVMTVSMSNSEGVLLKFNLSGALLSSTQTSAVIKDLCLVNDRLFCVPGDEIFFELNPLTGYSIANFNLPGRPVGNNINGIAFSGSKIQLADTDSLGRLRISEIEIPAK